MKRPESKGFQLECGLAAALLCLSAAPAVAQAPAAAPAKKAAKPTAPPLTGPGSLNGVWNNPDFKDSRTGPPVGEEHPLQTADGQPIPYQPAAAEFLAKRRADTKAGKPAAGNGSSCLPNGMPSMMRPPIELPLQILETPTQTTVLFEFFGTFRIIRMNDKHPADPDPTFMGDSVGHWEGNTLVVDTIALNDKTMVAGVPHGDDLHLVERLRRTSKTTLEDRMTITDPKAFTRPWTWVIDLKEVPGMRIMEYVCENERNGVDANGATGVKLPPPK